MELLTRVLLFQIHDFQQNKQTNRKITKNSELIGVTLIRSLFENYNYFLFPINLQVLRMKSFDCCKTSNIHIVDTEYIFTKLSN